MADPYRVFKANESKQRTLLALWPELHAALAGTSGTTEGDTPAPPPEARLTCVISPCDTAKPRPRAVARLSKWGPQACAAHVADMADRPGGWPLDLKGHRK